MKHLFYSISATFGVSLGLFVSMNLMSMHHTYSSFDTHQYADNLYRVELEYDVGGRKGRSVLLPKSVGVVIKEQISGVENGGSMTPYMGDSNLRYGDKVAFDVRTYEIEKSILKMFDIRVAETPAIDLSGRSAFLKADVYKRLIGDSPETNILYFMSRRDTMAFTQVESFQSFGRKSHLDVSLLYISEQITLSESGQSPRQSGEGNSSYIYIQLAPEADPDLISQQVNDVIGSHFPRQFAGVVRNGGSGQAVLSHVSEIYALPPVENDFAQRRSPQLNQSLIILAYIFFAYSFLSSVLHAVLSGRKLGSNSAIMRIYGAEKRDIAFYVQKDYGKNLLMVALWLVVFELVLYVRMGGGTYYFREDHIAYFAMLIILVVFFHLVSSLVTYTIVWRSSRSLHREVNELKRLFYAYSLVQGVQIVSVALLISFFLLSSAQLNMLQDISLGFNSDNVLTINLRTDQSLDPELLIAQLSELSFVEKATSVGTRIPSDNFPHMLSVTNESEGEKRFPNTILARYDFSDLLGLSVIAGRLPDSERLDGDFQIVINRSAMTSAGWTVESAIGQIYNSGFRQTLRVVAVVEDFVYVRKDHEIQPVAIMELRGARQLLIRLSGRLTDSQAIQLRTILTSNPGVPMEYVELSNVYMSKYSMLITASRLAGILLGLMIVAVAILSFMSSGIQLLDRRKSFTIRYMFGARRLACLQKLIKPHVYIAPVCLLVAYIAFNFIVSTWIGEYAIQIENVGTIFLLSFGVAYTLHLLGAFLAFEFQYGDIKSDLLTISQYS